MANNCSLILINNWKKKYQYVQASTFTNKTGRVLSCRYSFTCFTCKLCYRFFLPFTWVFGKHLLSKLFVCFWVNRNKKGVSAKNSNHNAKIKGWADSSKADILIFFNYAILYLWIWNKNFTAETSNKQLNVCETVKFTWLTHTPSFVKYKKKKMGGAWSPIHPASVSQWNPQNSSITIVNCTSI